MRRSLLDFAETVLERLFPPDPGSLRLLAAARATLGGLLTLLLILPIGAAMGWPITDRVLGFAVSLLIGATTRDAARRDQAITMLLAPVPAFLATAMAALLLPVPLLGDVAVVLIVFAAICGAARGPRGAALGMLTLIAFILGLVTRPTPDQLPGRLIVILLAAADAALVRFVLLPERPAADLRRMELAVAREIARVLARIEAALREGRWRPGARRRLLHASNRVNEAAMAAQMTAAAVAAIRPDDANRGLHLLNLELAAEGAARIAAADLGPEAGREPLLARLGSLRRALLSGRPPSEGDAPDPGSALGRAVGVLARLLRETPRPVPPPAPAAAPAGASGLRPAAQAAAAAALAIFCGELVSPSRWYWAAFAAFALFQGTRSRGESVAKAVQFMAGTLAGVVAGMLVATLLSGHDLLAIAVIVAAVFLAFHASTAAYGVMVFWITVILGLLFGLLGFLAPELLLIRLKETAVGAACGILVAMFLLPRPTDRAVEGATSDFLRALGALVAAGARAMLDGAPEPGALGLALDVERRFQELRAAARPELHGIGAFGHDRLRRRLLLLGACDYWGREFGRLSLSSGAPPDPAMAGAMRAAADRIAANVERLRAALAGAPPPAPAAPDAEPMAARVTRDIDDPVYWAARRLLQIDAALLHIAQRVLPGPRSASEAAGSWPAEAAGQLAPD